MTQNLDPVLGGQTQSSDPVLGGIEALKRALASDDPQVLSRVVEQLPNYGVEGIDLLIGVVNRDTQWEVRFQAWVALERFTDLQGRSMPYLPPLRDVGGTVGLKERYRKGERDFRFANLSRQETQTPLGSFILGADLSGVDLSGINLSEADLNGANLSNTNLSNANLSKAILSSERQEIRLDKSVIFERLNKLKEETEAMLTPLQHSGSTGKLQQVNETIEGSDRLKNLSDQETKKTLGSLVFGTDLSNANLSNANLSGANLNRANLSRTNLNNTDLRNSSLRNANLSGADLNYADLTGADLSGADLQGATLGNSKIDDATKLDAKWRLVWEVINNGARNKSLSRCDFLGANLSNANLSRADLRYADLRYADLSGANLSGANLSNANLEGTHLQAANLKGATLPSRWGWYKDLKGTIMPDGSVHR